LIKILSDIFNYIQLKKHRYEVGFFCENLNIFEYLKPYIRNKSKKKKILLISFQKINKDLENVKQFHFQTNFMRELVFLTLNIKYLYSSTPGLNQNLFKKSKLSGCKYIYLQHSLCSMTMIYHKDVFDNFEAIQAVTNYQYNELYEIKNIRKLKFKIFKSNYLFLKDKFEVREKIIKKNVLIAPTWSTDFFKNKLHEKLSSLFNKNKITYDLRPHPMSFNNKEITTNELENLKIPLNIENNLNFYNYDLLISDWSGIFIEFAVLKKKVLLIDTDKKILNYNYDKLKNQPVEIRLRNVLAKNFSSDDLENLVSEIKKNINMNNKNLINIDKYYFEL